MTSKRFLLGVGRVVHQTVSVVLHADCEAPGRNEKTMERTSRVTTLVERLRRLHFVGVFKVDSCLLIRGKQDIVYSKTLRHQFIGSPKL